MGDQDITQVDIRKVKDLISSDGKQKNAIAEVSKYSAKDIATIYIMKLCLIRFLLL